MNNIVNAPKTDTFKFRINPEIRKTAETIFAGCGLTMTQAINLFLQQSINAGGLPFSVKAPTDEDKHAWAVERLREELDRGLECSTFYDEEEIYRMFGVKDNEAEN